MLDGLEGRKSLELIIAIYEAASTRKEVRLRYIPENVPLGRGARFDRGAAPRQARPESP
jgi:hypothetical protein